MNVEQIVKDHLTKNGYDGLCTKGCGCIISDLAPCLAYAGSSIPGECNPGYRHNHTEGGWIISTDKTPKTDSEILAIILEADL